MSVDWQSLFMWATGVWFGIGIALGIILWKRDCHEPLNFRITWFVISLFAGPVLLWMYPKGGDQ